MIKMDIICSAIACVCGLNKLMSVIFCCRNLTEHVQVKTTAGSALGGSESISSSYRTPGMSSEGSKATPSPQTVSTPQHM